MIKEKHDNSSDNTKEEAGTSDKEATAAGEVRANAKKDDEVNKKEQTKNGGIIGSTNTGSMDSRKALQEEQATAPGGDVHAALKEECMDQELPPDGGFPPLGPAAPGGLHHPPADGVQPLASNVINKQPSSMEVHYMQQQSQIFVFSTVLANSGADEVVQGRYPSIIAYHCAQPGTKKYLEKNPLKVTQFNRQNPAQWLNMAMMKNKRSPGPPGGGAGGGGGVNVGGGVPAGGPPPKQLQTSTLDTFLGPDGLDDMVALTDSDLHWDQKNNHLDGLESVSNGLPDVGGDMDACSPLLSNVQPSLQGVKVPDENLTPSQRQHREVQLATIRKIQHMLFPENQSGGGDAATPAAPGDAIASTSPPTATPPSADAPQSAQMEWQKLQHQFYEDRTKVVVKTGPVSGGGGPNTTTTSSNMPSTPPPPPPPPPRTGTCPPTRLQGPPPPYHQTPRSASVPIALQSPNPASPNNPTSNLSLPSPRASSALNSPADRTAAFGLGRHMTSPTSQDSPRLNHSNPGTPLSSHHLSPSVTDANPSVDGMFGRTMQKAPTTTSSSTTNSSTQSAMVGGGMGKEPNLMPVPSPQQIQYLNTFEGQELIIQKQPNTSLKEGNIISSPILATSMEGGFSGNLPDLPHNRGMSGPNTPTSMDVVGGRFPPTPSVPSDGCRFQIPSPHTPSAMPTQGDKQVRNVPGLSPQTVPGPNSDPLKNDLFPTPSPHMMDVQRFPGPNGSPGGGKMGGPFVNVSPQGGGAGVNKPGMDMAGYGGCVGRGDNVPLNPNSNASGGPKVSHFDPISSLAQMSQQLTNSVAGSLNGQQGQQGPVMMNFGSPSMHMMDMGCMVDMEMVGHGFQPMGSLRPLSPKLPGAFPNHMPMPRMMGRPPPPPPNPYNGANVQVKPNAPNTIQYLPAKSQVGCGPPRGPPSLEFLTRLATPINMMDSSKMPQGQYFSNGPMNPHMAPHHMDGGMGQDPSVMMPGHMGNGGGSAMGGNMAMPPGGGMMGMMRPQGGGMRPPMMRMPQMNQMGGAFGGGQPEPMFNPGPGNAGQMFVSGPKGSPMGMVAPDASQPLPPSMGQNNSFKTYVGPSTADPNYAQQFHNFQQQLYSMNTRNQMGPGPGPGPPPGPPPHMQQPPYFNPK